VKGYLAGPCEIRKAKGLFVSPDTAQTSTVKRLRQFNSKDLLIYVKAMYICDRNSRRFQALKSSTLIFQKH
jgi:hypothetical protein